MTVRFPLLPGQFRAMTPQARALAIEEVRWIELRNRVVKQGARESTAIEGLYRLVRRCQVSRGEKWALVDLPPTPWAWDR